MDSGGFRWSISSLGIELDESDKWMEIKLLIDGGIPKSISNQPVDQIKEYQRESGISNFNATA